VERFELRNTECLPLRGVVSHVVCRHRRVDDFPASFVGEIRWQSYGKIADKIRDFAAKKGGENLVARGEVGKGVYDGSCGFVVCFFYVFHKILPDKLRVKLLRVRGPPLIWFHSSFSARDMRAFPDSRSAAIR